MLDAAEGERFEEAAQLRDAMRTVQTLQDRQQKMATMELGHRDVFGLKLGPAGVAIQIFQVRSGRVVERIELGTEEADRRRERRRNARSGDPAVLRAARRAAGDPRAGRTERAGSARELAVGARRPARANHRAAARREARLRRSREPQRRARVPDTVQPGKTAQYDALETLQHVLACRRCRGASNASTSRRSRAARPWRRWWCAKTAG